jgi:spore coat protein U-like protein
MRTVVTLLLVFGAHAVSLGQSGASIWVSARVENQCRLVGGKLDFGDYNPIGLQATQPLDAEARFEVHCTPGAVVQVYLESGLHAMGDRRRMVGPSTKETLEYGLFFDVGRSSAWLANAPLALQQFDQQPRRVPVFGRIPQGQDVSAGTYEDSVLIMVRF